MGFLPSPFRPLQMVVGFPRFLLSPVLEMAATTLVPVLLFLASEIRMGFLLLLALPPRPPGRPLQVVMMGLPRVVVPSPVVLALVPVLLFLGWIGDTGGVSSVASVVSSLVSSSAGDGDDGVVVASFVVFVSFSCCCSGARSCSSVSSIGD